MAELKNRQWLLAARPQGIIKESDFRWNETAVPPLKDGQVLVRNLAFSFDPTQRGWMSMDTYMPAIPIGQTMKAGTVGQVVESKRPGFAKGDLVQGLFGWEDYTVSGGEGLMGLQKLPAGTDPILALSMLGMTGLTAYFGTLAVGAVKAGETFVVSGAAGATGSVAGMIAKIKGCRVVGIAGGREKCEWLLKEAGFDAAIDYKNENVGEALSKHCPQGINVYFDNVGGEILDDALARLASDARIVLCGAISQYNNLGERNSGRAEELFQPDIARRADGRIPRVSFPAALSRGDRRDVEVVRRGQDQEPDRSAEGTRKRAEDDHPAVHRRELRQAVVEAGRSAIDPSCDYDRSHLAESFGFPEEPRFL